jgi:hypothetical protein
LALNNICRFVFVDFYGLQVTATFLQAIITIEWNGTKSIRQVRVILPDATEDTEIHTHAAVIPSYFRCYEIYAKNTKVPEETRISFSPPSFFQDVHSK